MKDDNRLDSLRKKYRWLLEMGNIELRSALQQYDSDLLLIYDTYGLDPVLILWEHFSGVPFYASKRSLYKLAAIYARKNYDPDHSEASKKAMALKMGVCLRTVEVALATTDKIDSRQLTLIMESDR